MASYEGADEVRAEIGRALGNDEVWRLLDTFEGFGQYGTTRVELWHHPDAGYLCRAHPEEGESVQSNPEPTAVLAMQTPHLWNLGTHE